MMVDTQAKRKALEGYVGTISTSQVSTRVCCGVIVFSGEDDISCQLSSPTYCSTGICQSRFGGEYSCARIHSKMLWLRISKLQTLAKMSSPWDNPITVARLACRICFSIMIMLGLCIYKSSLTSGMNCM